MSETDTEELISPESTTRETSSDSFYSSSDNNDDPTPEEHDFSFSMRPMSYFCLFSCAGWTLYNCNYESCVFLCIPSVIILGYGFIGVFRERSRHVEMLFWYFKAMADILPISLINAHVFTCDCACNKYKVLAVLFAIPLILKIIYPERNRRILDIIVWSNVHTLGVKAVEHASLYGLITTIWQAFYYLVSQNSKTWLESSPEIPFNMGLSGLCWCIFSLNIDHKEAIDSLDIDHKEAIE